MFQSNQEPMVQEASPMLEELERILCLVRDAGDIHASVRIAAQTALYVIEKYYALMDDCWIYAAAISKLGSIGMPKHLILW